MPSTSSASTSSPTQPSVFKIPTTRLKEDGKTPLYRQLYNVLRKQIESGKVSQNTHLPSEQELTRKLGISRITVRRALNELAASGLVKRQRGRGTIVTFNATAPNVKASFDNLIEGLNRMGVETEVELIDYKFIRADRSLIDVMELDPGSRVQKIVRLRTLDKEPFSYLVTHIPDYVAADYDEEELASASLIKLLETSGHAPRAAQQTITAAAAETDIAKALGIAPGSPIMRIHRLMRDKEGKVVQEITAHYRADRFHYQMDLVRHGETSWTTTDQV